MLFGGTTRAVFIYLDYADRLRVHWTQRILSEMSAALVAEGRKPHLEAALANERLMNRSVETALVDQTLVDRHESAMRAYVRDIADAHVVACAYELVIGGYYADGGAVVLSTRNLADYKVAELATLNILVRHPDDFLMSLPLGVIAAAFRSCRLDLASQPEPERLLVRLDRDGNPRIARALRDAAALGKVRL